jgi:hypothetical protein
MVVIVAMGKQSGLQAIILEGERTAIKYCCFIFVVDYGEPVVHFQGTIIDGLSSVGSKIHEGSIKIDDYYYRKYILLSTQLCFVPKMKTPCFEQERDNYILCK